MSLMLMPFAEKTSVVTRLSNIVYDSSPVGNETLSISFGRTSVLEIRITGFSAGGTLTIAGLKASVSVNETFTFSSGNETLRGRIKFDSLSSLTFGTLVPAGRIRVSSFLPGGEFSTGTSTSSVSGVFSKFSRRHLSRGPLLQGLPNTPDLLFFICSAGTNIKQGDTLTRNGEIYFVEFVDTIRLGFLNHHLEISLRRSPTT